MDENQIAETGSFRPFIHINPALHLPSIYSKMW